MTYRQSPLLFCGLYDFFALWSASLVPSAAQLPNYNVTVHNSKTRTPKKQRPRAPKKCTAHGLAVIHSFRPCFGEGGGGGKGTTLMQGPPSHKTRLKSALWLRSTNAINKLTIKNLNWWEANQLAIYTQRREQIEIAVGWRIWTRDLQISNPAP